MRIVLTGAAGFLGWHTRLRLHAHTDYEVVPVTRSTWSQLPALIDGADAVVHIAGVNRGTDAEVEQGNIQLAEELADALARSPAPARVVFANSTQAGNETPYGNGKAAASSILRAVADIHGSHFVDVRLPNVFGEHGRPRYNSFVATFIDAVIAGQTPSISDRNVELVSAQEAAATLINATASARGQLHPSGVAHSVRQVWDLLREFHDTYSRAGEFPDLTTDFQVDLFNAYLAASFPSRYPILLSPRSDPRGTFVETVRSQGGEGQASFSSTVPGATRGEHYHLRKIERFTVIAGQARVSARKMFDQDAIHFDVDGKTPVAIDMPIGWAHNITNTGEQVLLTQFWTNELFKPERPDTFREPVVAENGGASL